MLYFSSIISIGEVLVVTLPVLLTVAFITIAERKTMASMQRRLGPNVVGYYGLLQAFADALKLLLKEYVSPTQANLILFFLGPIITLIFSLLGYAVVPFGPGLTIFDFNLGILFMLAVSSLSTYGILLAGWSANSKYAFLGSLRSTAQLISYELILSSAILLVVLLTSTLSLTGNIESQKPVWFVLPLFPIFIIFFIGAIAETNRAPFDLAEAESELVSGFMTEHSAVIFVFFFLAEYASIVLICTVTSILFLGGYNSPIFIFDSLINQIYDIFVSLVYIPHNVEDIHVSNLVNQSNIINNDSVYFVFTKAQEITGFKFEGLMSSLSIAIKSLIMIFVFIWVRASFPRIRFDQLMTDCWTKLLPLIFAFIITVPCILYTYHIIPNNIIF